MASKEPGSDLPPKLVSVFKSISKFYDNKLYKKAIKAANQILAEHPRHGDTLALKGLVLHTIAETKEQHEEAFGFVKRGVAFNVKNFVSWHILGNLYSADKNLPEAMKCYTQALRNAPHNHQILRDLAAVQIQVRELQGYCKTRLALLREKSTRKDYWISYILSCHLIKDYAKTILTIDLYEKNETPKKDIEWSELFLYKALVQEEAGRYQDALETLTKRSDFILDTVARLEARGRLFLKAGQYEDAEQVFRKLLKINTEHKLYHKGLLDSVRISINNKAQINELDSLYQQLAQEYPRSSLVKHMPLVYLAAGDVFRYRLEEYIKPVLVKGVPQLFGTLKPLYADAEKTAIIEKVILDNLASLEASGLFFNSKDDEKEPPSTVVWTQFFLAQHYSKLGKQDLALEIVNKAIAHSPTVLDLYVFKARIYKRAGNSSKAAKWLDFARELDLADRWLNTKATKYFLRDNQVEKAESTIALFSRDQETAQSNLYDMQCIWYEQEAGDAYFRVKDFGRSLKKLTAIEAHFQEIYGDQTYFHSFCVRKMTLSAYMSMIKMEDALFTNSRCFKACVSAINTFLTIDDEKAHLVPAEEPKKEAEVVVAPAEDSSSSSSSSSSSDAAAEEPKKEDPDLDGKGLYLGKNVLEEANYFAKLLKTHLPGRFETHAALFEISLRKKKYLLALQALNKMRSIADDHPVSHLSLIKLTKSLEEAEVSEIVKQITDLELPSLRKAASLAEENQQYIAAHSASLPHLLTGAKASLIVSPSLKDEAPNIVLSFEGQTNAKDLIETSLFLKNSISEESFTAFKSKWGPRFPLSILNDFEDAPLIL